MAQKRRRLTDLYVVGKEVPINDNSGGEPLVVWVQKLNPLQSETALRKAGAARARYIATRKDKDSEEYRDAMSDVLDYSERETLVEVVARDDLYAKRMAVEAEIGAEEEWTKDDYLQGLFDAWQGGEGEEGLKDRYAIDKEDEEAKRVFAELQRYNAQVDKIMEGERARIISDYSAWPDEKLTDRAVARVIENRSLTVFLKELETQQIFFAVRDPDDHKKLYFESVEEAASIADEVRTAIVDNLRMIAVERDEGKGSAGTPASSPSSEPSETVVTEASSGLVTASP
jgi:hypothetical protein